MKSLKFSFLMLLGVLFVFSSCEDDDTSSSTTTGSTDPVEAGSTPTSAFDEFDDDNVTITFSGTDVSIQSNGVPNHTSPYWDANNSLYISPVIADPNEMSLGAIGTGSYSLTVPISPEVASSSSATGLGAIGIAVSGVPIFNDEEGPNVQLTANVASGFDYAGGHMGPTGYHYHLESQDVAENTTLSHDDDQLIGILEDGFLLYGRQCNATGDYPTDLDASGGHTGATQHSDGEVFYHYHVINEIYTGSYIVLFGQDLQGTPNGVM